MQCEGHAGLILSMLDYRSSRLEPRNLTVKVPLPPEAQMSGEGGGGAAIG